MKWNTEETKNNGFQVQWDPGGQKMSRGPPTPHCLLSQLRPGGPPTPHCLAFSTTSSLLVLPQATVKMPTLNFCLKRPHLVIPP